MVGGHRRNQSFPAQVIVERLAVRVGACPVVAVGVGGLIGNRSGRMRIAAPRRIHLRVSGVTQEMWSRQSMRICFSVFDIFFSPR